MEGWKINFIDFFFSWMGFLSKRGYSSVGRTSDLRSEGHVFDPRLLLRWEFFFLGGVGGVGRKP